MRGPARPGLAWRGAAWRGVARFEEEGRMLMGIYRGHLQPALPAAEMGTIMPLQLNAFRCLKCVSKCRGRMCVLESVCVWCVCLSTTP